MSGAMVVGQLSEDPSFERMVSEVELEAEEEHGFCLHWPVEGLAVDSSYSYRFVANGGSSETGTLRTAPAGDEPASFRFVLTGDSDGTRDSEGRGLLNEFEVLDAARADRPAFFLYIGDTIYSDSVRRLEAATSLNQYRAAYEENRGYAALRGILAATPVFAMLDDHEVHNDFAGETVEPARYSAGYRAFRDYFPLGGTPDEWAGLSGPTDAAPLYRSFRWGGAAEFFILDTRTYRSALARAACFFEAPSYDLIPALGRPEAASDLMAIRAFLDYPQGTAPECLTRLDDPERTILGEEQKRWLKDGLLASDARFKFVITGEPIQELFVNPYDRWEGFAAERREILEFIGSEGIQNVIFLTTDMHGNMINDVSPDYLAGEPPVAVEVITGPIAANTFAREIQMGAGIDLPAAFISFAREIAGTRCLEIDVYSYALFEVDADAGTVTVSIKDAGSRIIYQETFGGS